MSNESGTLELGEVHPSAYYARDYINTVGFLKMCQLQESMASCAIEGNRLAEICLETWRRLQEGLPVSDRYIMGLALFIMKMFEVDDERVEEGIKRSEEAKKILKEVREERD